jgi:hypothetical protein
LRANTAAACRDDAGLELIDAAKARIIDFEPPAS